MSTYCINPSRRIHASSLFSLKSFRHFAALSPTLVVACRVLHFFSTLVIVIRGRSSVVASWARLTHGFEKVYGFKQLMDWIKIGFSCAFQIRPANLYIEADWQVTRVRSLEFVLFLFIHLFALNFIQAQLRWYQVPYSHTTRIRAQRLKAWLRQIRVLYTVSYRWWEAPLKQCASWGA